MDAAKVVRMWKKAPYWVMLIVFLTGTLLCMRNVCAQGDGIKSILHEAYAEEEKIYPALRDFLNDTSKKPYQTALKYLTRKRRQMTYEGLHAYLRRPEMKKRFSDYTGITLFLSKAQPIKPQGKPHLSSLIPSAGLPGETLNIYGRHLESVNFIVFNKGRAAHFNYEKSGLTVTIPQGAKTGPITVTNPGGSAQINFTIYTGQCQIPDITKAYDAVLGRIPRGEGVLGDCDRKLYNLAAPTFENIVQFLKEKYKNSPALKKPLVEYPWPYEGKVGDKVNLYGKNLKYTTWVEFHREWGTPRRGAEFKIISPEEIQVTIPENAASGPILVTTVVDSVKSPQSFTVTGVPTITHINPSGGYPGETVVEIHGKYLDKLREVTLGGIKVEPEQSGPRKIKILVPENATDGKIVVKTRNGTAAPAKDFEIVPRPPDITSVEPQVTYIGDTVAIEGKRFQSVQEVRFGKTIAKSELVSDNEIKVTVPDAPGYRLIYLTTQQGTTITGQNIEIKIPPPKITGITTKAHYPERLIFIRGKNFREVRKVEFGANLAERFEVINNVKLGFGGIIEDRIKVWIPKAAPGQYPVSVTTDHGTANSDFLFRIKAIPPPSKPVITEIVPKGNRLGAPAVIQGKYLTAIESITFKNRRLKPNEYEESVTSYQITLKSVPWGLVGPGMVKVKTKAGETSTPLISNKFIPVRYGVNGQEEKCFGAVGKQCRGLQLQDFLGGRIPPPPLGYMGSTNTIFTNTGCFEVKHGKRECWVAPGSIKHDNCCVRHPEGHMCGGSESSDICKEEWDLAEDDVFWGRTFLAIFPITYSDLTPVQSTRYPMGETRETERLCAPDGTHLSRKHDAGFCCSKTAFVGNNGDDWMECGSPPKLN
ncbi:MAG: IPT/TIG domain-containing protein [Acidobacteriota bacterium]